LYTSGPVSTGMGDRDRWVRVTFSQASRLTRSGNVVGLQLVLSNGFLDGGIFHEMFMK